MKIWPQMLRKQQRVADGVVLVIWPDGWEPPRPYIPIVPRPQDAAS